MHEKNTPGVPGQETDLSTPASIAEIITLLRSIGARFEVLEKRFGDLAALEAAAGAELELPRIPTLALTNDGRLLISVHYLSKRAAEGRETWPPRRKFQRSVPALTPEQQAKARAALKNLRFA
ncbi:MAG TPA: hypothetical protein VE093_03940 [Polyangiaceae bacterium]|nr:hypothetical protein [Polyangiaceae bacterium]